MSHVRCQGARVRMHCTAASSSVHVPLSMRSSSQKGVTQRKKRARPRVRVQPSPGPRARPLAERHWTNRAGLRRPSLESEARAERRTLGTELGQLGPPGRRTPGADHSPKRPRWPSPARRAEGADSTRGSRQAFGTTPCPLAATAPRKVELKTP